MNDPLSKAKALEEAHRKPLPPRIEEAKQEFEKTFGPVKVENVIDKAEEQRTIQQNKALHKFFELLADALNDSGLDMRKTLKPGIDIPWNRDRCKEFLWRPIQEAMTGKTSTTELNTVEPSEIYAVLDRHLSSKFGIHIEWPTNTP